MNILDRLTRNDFADYNIELLPKNLSFKIENYEEFLLSHEFKNPDYILGSADRKKEKKDFFDKEAEAVGRWDAVYANILAALPNLFLAKDKQKLAILTKIKRCE